MMWFGIYIVVMSCIAFCLYGIDKRRAIHQKWRISENVLLGSAFLGGGLGAYIGMNMFHHKTKHLKFRIFVPISVILWIIIAFVIQSFVQ